MLTGFALAWFLAAGSFLVLLAAGMVLGWRLRGQAWPHPYFDRAKATPKPREP